MHAAFGHDFAHVRVHTDEAAQQAAARVGARAFAVGSDIAFARDRYAPDTTDGRRLLGHELAHVVQQEQGGDASASEMRAAEAGHRVAQGRSVSVEGLGSAEAGMHRDADGKPAPPSPPAIEPFTLPWSVLPPHLWPVDLPQLRPPSSLSPPDRKPLIEMPALAPKGGGAPLAHDLGLPKPLLPLGPAAVGTAPLGPRVSPLSLAGGPSSMATNGPDLPSRLSLEDLGPVSAGIRFGLPLAPEPVEGTPPDRRLDPSGLDTGGQSQRAHTAYQMDLLHIQMTGRPPTGLDAVAKGELVKIAFSLAATHIAAEQIRRLAASVGGKPGAKIQLDATMFGDFKGGGITFSTPLLDAKPARANEGSE